MYPSWGNYGAPQPNNFGGAGPRKPLGASHGGQAAGFGGFEAPASSSSMFSSLQEQHLQQMQQLQMLHQKQLQSVLQHGNSANTYGGGLAAGYSGTSWQSDGSGQVDNGARAPSFYGQQDDTAALNRGVPPATKQGHQQPPPPPAQAHAIDSQPAPPPSESQPAIPPDSNGPPKAKEPGQEPVTAEDKSFPLQEQQHLWYKQHLQNLQKLKQERAKLNQGDGPMPPPVPPVSLETIKGTPPPPPPKEEPPTPPPPPVETKPEVPKDPEEAVRLQQLQAAAAQWQQVQQQRVGLQYQALMQQHEKLQKILERYQQVIQQPPNLQSMTTELQLRHHEMQQQQFTPLFQDWDRTFALWYEQFKTYPHKDQLQDYEHQWKQWQEQMNATNVHLQERVATLTATVPFNSGHFNSGMMGQFGQFPGQDMQMQQQTVNTGVQPPPVAVGPAPQSAPPASFGTHSDAAVGPPVQGSVPAGLGVPPPCPQEVPPQNFNNVRGPRGNNPRFDGPTHFDQPPQRFDGPPRFNQPQQRFDGPPRFNQPQQRFDAPPRFDQPQQRFDAPPRFDQPQQRFDAPPRFDQPARFDGPPRFDQQTQRFENPPRFDSPRHRFDGPPRFDQPRHRFDGPPRFDQPRHRFDGPPRFEQPRPRFDGPPRFEPPRFGQQPRFEDARFPGPPPRFDGPPVQQQQHQGPPPKSDQPAPKPPGKDSTTPDKSASQLISEKEKCSTNDILNRGNSTEEDMTDDNLLGNDGFFVQHDPIPQTISTNMKSDSADDDKSSDSSETPKPVTIKPSVIPPPAPVSKNTPQNKLKPEGPLTNDKPLNIPKPPEAETQSAGELQSRSEPLKPPTGRGRGHTGVPPQIPGRGRGHIGSGEFRGPNTAPHDEQTEEMPYNYVPPEENLGMSEEQEDYHWQDSSYEEFGGEESEGPPEEMWMPEEHYQGDEYYEEPMGGPYMGRGRPPMMRGGPPMGRGGPPMGRGGPPMGRGGFPMGRGGPPMGRGGPPMGRGGPPMGRGGPPMGRGGPPMGRGGPPMMRGGPPMMRGGPPMMRGGPHMMRGGPPMGRGGPPRGRGGPPMGRGGPPMGGEPMDREWEEDESAEYSEEGDPYWMEMRPPMRGMRPPFPPGRGRPPRGHPPFMHQGRGRPPHHGHGPIEHENLDYGANIDDSNMDPSRHPMFHGHDPDMHPMHPEGGRGRRRGPPPPHEIMDSMEEAYHDETEKRDLSWQPSQGRGGPLPPHEVMNRGGMRRRPMGRGMARGMFRPAPNHEDYDEGYKEGFTEDYNHGDEGYRWRPTQDFVSKDYQHDTKFHESEWDRDRPLPERNYPPRMPPPESVRDNDWEGERERKRPYPFEEHDRGKGELRIREYRDEPYRRDEPPFPPPSDWERSSRLPPLTERDYTPDYQDSRPRYEGLREDRSLDRPAAPVTNLPESSTEAAPQETNVLALSQRQHEIILKAAQELKLIRELQEGKTPVSESQQPAAAEVAPELPAGLLGLEIPPDIRNVLKGMSTSAQLNLTESLSWENKSASAPYRSTLTAAALPPVIPKTVDYGHGHEPGTTVERISYGERIVLRPDPVPSDRGYEKEPLGPRDSYSRDPYYDRRSDSYFDRRDYGRERDSYREKPDYDRERYERDRYPPRERDDRSPLGPALRSAYRERDRDMRDKERSGSRDVDDHYGRPVYDRPSYERSAHDRSGPERYGHSSSPYMDRRSYPEERGPSAAPPLPPPPQPPPRIEKKPEIKNIDDILKPPGRLTRPERIVIIMRGLPGSGKSHVAKLIRDKEVDCGGAPPRVLVLDDYFMTEVEKTEKDPDTGRRVKTKGLEYEYEPEMEDTYRSSMLKTFKKTLDDGFFPFIILDTINDKVKHFDQFWSAAKTKGFEVYLAEITADTQTCAKRNVHGRTLKDITKMSSNWEASPRHMVRLDVRSLLQDAAIEEVEMEDFNPDDEPKEPKREEEEEGDLGYIPKSKWEMDTSEAKLDKLDGLGSSGKRKRDSDHMAGLEDYLQLPDDYATRMSQPGKKRVRWADLEEQKDADRKRAIGFVVGQTDWEKITDESGQLAQRALNRTKYF